MSSQLAELSSKCAEPLKIWNCINCRRRKVRCDRRHPCTPCTRNKAECVFPTSGRISRRNRDAIYPNPPAQKQGELVGRLRRLEAMVGGLTSQVENAVAVSQDNQLVEGSLSLASTIPNDSGWQAQSAFRRQQAGGKTPNNHFDEQTGLGNSGDISESSQISDDFGVLEVASNGDLVVGARFWTVFCKEVEDIFAAVQGHTVMHFDDDSSSSTSGSSHHTGYYKFLLRSTSSAHQNKDIYPLPSQMLFIWQIYMDNVDPFLKVLHSPTMAKAIRGIRGSYDSLGPNMQALVLSISLAAIMSLEAEEVKANFNIDKDQLIGRYRLGAEHALEQADFLNKPDIIVLQALTIYLSVLQHTGETRSAWLLAGLLVRVAVSMKLHHNVSNQVNAIEREMRCRLWWQTCFIDSRSEELQVSAFKLSEGSFNTDIPANVNDADLDPEMPQPLDIAEGWTDMTIFLIRCEVWKLSRRLQSVTAGFSTEIIRKVELFQQSQATIECTYLKHLNPNQPLHSFVAASLRLFWTRVDLILHSKLQASRGQAFDTSQSERLFRSSLSIIEHIHALQNEPSWSGWRWQIQGQHPPWHALRVVLSHLSTRGWDPICDGAWFSARIFLESLSETARSDPRYLQLLALSTTVQKKADEYHHQASGASLSEIDDQTSMTALKVPAIAPQSNWMADQDPFISMAEEFENNAFGNNAGPEMNCQIWDEIAGDLEFWDMGAI